jgi:hypothetical protein
MKAEIGRGKAGEQKSAKAAKIAVRSAWEEHVERVPADSG